MAPWIASACAVLACFASAAIPLVFALRLDADNRRLRSALARESAQRRSAELEVRQWRELYPQLTEMDLSQRKTLVWRAPPEG